MLRRTRPGALLFAALVMIVGCLGPVGRPVTAPVPEGTKVQLHSPSDTLHVRWTDGATTDSGTVGGGTAALCAATRLDGIMLRQSADTTWLRDVSNVVPALRSAGLECHRRGGAMVIAPAASLRTEQLVPVSAPVQIGGSLLLIGAVAGFSLLLFNAADGLFGIVERWF